MRNRLLLPIVAITAALSGFGVSSLRAARPATAALPPSEGSAKEALEHSPRHGVEPDDRLCD